MNKFPKITLLLGISAFLITGCSNAGEFKEEDRLSVGIMLSDSGLGDQSFNDTAFKGLIKARDELDITFEYKEINDTKSYEKGFEELVSEGHDLIIGLGFTVQEDLEKVAKKYPKQPFILIDSVSEQENVTNITFKEEEGSFLIGAIAAMKSKNNNIGFVGGVDIELIHKFAAGYTQGARYINPNVKLQVEYANTFGDDKIGSQIASNMIDKGADVIYPAAGFTGFGSLKASEQKGIYSIGVDTDQYFIAEKSVITSMLKNVDVAIYQAVKTFKENGKFESNMITLGFEENGIGYAPIRITSLTDAEKNLIENIKKDIINGKIVINSVKSGVLK